MYLLKLYYKEEIPPTEIILYSAQDVRDSVKEFLKDGNSFYEVYELVNFI